MSSYFHLDNNEAPSIISLISPTEEQTGFIILNYVVFDREMDSLHYDYEYSTDSGSSYRPATVSGVASATNVQGSLLNRTQR